jgi:hypothetical protein
MKHAFLTGAIAFFAFLLVRPLAAADLGTMPVKALPVPAPFDWTGFYVGKSLSIINSLPIQPTTETEGRYQ